MNEIMGSDSLLALVVDAFKNDATTQLCLIVLFIFFVVWYFFVRPSYARKNIEGHTEELKKIVLGEISEVSETTKNWFMQYFVVNALADQGDSSLQLTENKKALLKVPAEDVVSLTAPYHGESKYAFVNDYDRCIGDICRHYMYSANDSVTPHHL